MFEKLDNKLGKKPTGLVWLIVLPDGFADLKNPVPWVKERQAVGERVTTLVTRGMGDAPKGLLSRLNLVSTAWYDDTIQVHIPRMFPKATHGICVGGDPHHDKEFRKVLGQLPADHPMVWQLWTKQGMSEMMGQGAVSLFSAPPAAPVAPPTLGSARPPGKSKPKEKVVAEEEEEVLMDVLDLMADTPEAARKALGYTIDQMGGVESITCLTCKRTSYHPKDVENRYCGFCKKFHEGDPNA